MINKNKKGTESLYGLEYIVMIVIVIIVLASMIYLVNTFMGIKLGTKQVENSIFIKRILYQPNLISYQDEITKRTYPGVIDNSKFDSDRINNILINNNDRLAAVIELKNLYSDEIKTIYINEKRAKAWQPISEMGDFDTTNLKRYVRIYDEGKFYPGLLNIRAFVKIK